MCDRPQANVITSYSIHYTKLYDVIIACDFKNKEDLYAFLNKMEGVTPFLKIGMELFYKEGAPLVKVV